MSRKAEASSVGHSGAGDPSCFACGSPCGQTHPTQESAQECCSPHAEVAEATQTLVLIIGSESAGGERSASLHLGYTNRLVEGDNERIVAADDELAPPE